MNKLFFIITISFSFMMCSFPSYSEWKYFTTGGQYGEGAPNKNGNFKIYFDNKKIKIVDGFVHFRSLYEFTKEKNLNDKCSKSRIYLNKIDCQSNRFKRMKVQTLKLSKGVCVKSKVMDLVRTDFGKWKNTTPNTIKRDISDLMCESTKYGKQKNNRPNIFKKELFDEICKFDENCKK